PRAAAGDATVEDGDRGGILRTGLQVVQRRLVLVEDLVRGGLDALPAVVGAHRAAAVEAVVRGGRAPVAGLVAIQRGLDDRRRRELDGLLVDRRLDAPRRVEHAGVRLVEAQPDAGGRAAAQLEQLRLRVDVLEQVVLQLAEGPALA